MKGAGVQGRDGRSRSDGMDRMTRSRIASNGLRFSMVTRPLPFRAVCGSGGARWTDGRNRMPPSPRSGQILQFAASMAPPGPPWEVYSDGGVLRAQKGF